MTITHKNWLWIATVVLWLSLVLFAFSIWEVGKRRWATLDSFQVSGGDDQARMEVGQLMTSLRGQSLFDMDLLSLRQQLEDLSGVASAHISRQIQNKSLNIAVHSHQPLARWQAGGMVDVGGRRYRGVADNRLPMFKGPDNRSVEISELYDDAVKILGTDNIITQIELTERGDWIMFLEDGVMLRLGFLSPRQKLRLFAQHADSLHSRFTNLRSVDLRYEKGFSIIYDSVIEEDGDEIS